MKNALKHVEQKEAKFVHTDASKILSRVRKSYNVLEEVNFFSNSETKQISEMTLDNFYYIERYLRRLAFSGMDENPDDKNLTEFASTLSLGSLQELNAP